MAKVRVSSDSERPSMTGVTVKDVVRDDPEKVTELIEKGSLEKSEAEANPEGFRETTRSEGVARSRLKVTVTAPPPSS